MPTITEKIIYQNTALDFTGYDATLHSLKKEHEIRDIWQSVKNQHFFLLIITLGIAYFFLPTVVSKDELEGRISLFRDFSIDMEAKARVIQKAFARTLYKKKRITAVKMTPHLEPQFDSGLKTIVSLGRVWINEGFLNLWSGHRGQIIWHRTKALYKELQDHGYYVFLHAHSYPITLHLELATHFDRQHQSEDFKLQVPDESARKFRAPGVGRYFANTKEYMQSHIAHQINAGYSMDDNHRDTIISCDAIPENNEWYESAQHFFKSNRSIVDTHSSTGMTHKSFDSQFIRKYIPNYHLQEYALELFATARQRLTGIADYGMIRIIAIAKETIESEKTNYVWRSHAFGKLCTCRHTPNKYGHAEFVETLKKHQKIDYRHCNTGKMPQYRILAPNLDRDSKKQIFNMDCLNTQERETYNKIFADIQKPLSDILTLQTLPKAKSVEELAEIIQKVKLDEPSKQYQAGVRELLREHHELLKAEQTALARLLPEQYYGLICSL